MKVLNVSKIVSFEKLKKALIECHGPEKGEIYAFIVYCSTEKDNGHGVAVLSTYDTVITKVKDGYYKVHGAFAEDYEDYLN